MPKLDQHVPGTFNWFELATTDQTAAKSFYHQLFGWEALDSPMGPDRFYTMFKLDGQDAAAGYTIGPQMLEQGIPPHWDLYIAVESADDTAAKITSFGGKLIAPPFDVMDYGRMAVATDPTGAAFCVWQPLTHIGTTITGEPGTVCWADLNTTGPEAAAKFYAGVFGWDTFTNPNDPSNYMHIRNGSTGIGGIMQAYPGVPSHWLVYFLVADAEIATNQAGSLGATTRVPVTEIPNTGKFSIVQDPQGAGFALFEPAPRR
jgi:predicted enzyme related to lactoylglutathione lyase